MSKRCEIKKQDENLGEDKAWLLGHLAGDGNIYVGDTVSVMISAGLDRDLAVYCKALLMSIYGAPASIHEKQPGAARRKHVNYVVGCYWRAVAGDVLSFAPFGCDRWRVPTAVKTATRSVQGAYVSGFFDAEGSVVYTKAKANRRVSVCSGNEKGLREVSDLLVGLEIEHSWSVRPARPQKNWAESYSLIIGERDAIERYAVWCGFRSIIKQDKLKEVILSYRPGGGAGLLDRVVSWRLEGRTVAGVLKRAEIMSEDDLVTFLREEHGKVRPTNQGTKMMDSLASIARWRGEGKKWKEIGRLLDFDGDDQRVAVLAINVVQWAKKRGLWPIDSKPPTS